MLVYIQNPIQNNYIQKYIPLRLFMDITSRLNKHVCKVCTNSTQSYYTSLIILTTLNKVSPSRLLGSKLQGVFPLLSEWQLGVHQPRTKTGISMDRGVWLSAKAGNLSNVPPMLPALHTQHSHGWSTFIWEGLNQVLSKMPQSTD